MRTIITFCIALFLFSCSNVERLDTKAVKENMENYKIKRFTPSEIMTQLNKLGKAYEDSLSKISNVDCEKLKANMDSLASNYNAQFEILNINDIEITTIENSKLKLLYEAYKYEMLQDKTPPPNAQKIAEREYLYTFGLGKKKNYRNCEGFINQNSLFVKLSWTQQELVKSLMKQKS